MTDAPRPTVKLRPNKGRRFAEGAPWIYQDEVALDRRTRGLAPGTVVDVVAGDRPLGTFAFNGESQITLRLLDPEPGAEIGAAWFAARLSRAAALRERLFATPHYRLVHAEGDGLPGLVIDRFDDAFVIQPNAAWADARLAEIVEALDTVAEAAVIVMNGQGRARGLEGLSSETRSIRGAPEAPVTVPMNGALYRADLLSGQKTGIFYDQRPNHAFAASLARGGRVLDLYCHTGGFGLACLAAGAASAVGVDGSASALALAEAGAAAMGQSAAYGVRKGDVADLCAALAEEGAGFDLVISDPPAFAPHKGAAEAGLGAYERLARRAAGLAAAGGFLALCSCSHAVEAEAFHRANARGIRAAGRTAQLIHTGRAGPDHPVHPGLPETAYLKALFYRLDV